MGMVFLSPTKDKKNLKPGEGATNHETVVDHETQCLKTTLNGETCHGDCVLVTNQGDVVDNRTQCLKTILNGEPCHTEIVLLSPT